MQTHTQTHQASRPINAVSIEFQEGKDAYADGVDGYAATPYLDGTQEMTDWFAGWIAARNADREEVAA
jgi:hypothetical protein